VTGADHQNWMQGLVATQGRRTTVLAVALSVNLVIQLMNLLDVFDGAPTWVLIVVFAVQILLLVVIITLLVVNLRESTRQRR
jgi:membrane protein YdbS with pleckstrin-like domain